MIIRNALVYRNESRTLEKLSILVQNGKIVALGEKAELSDEKVFDADGLSVFPGLVDIHTHGIAGCDFVTCKEASLGKMAKSYADYGITTIMPTIASALYEDMLKAVRQINSFSPKDGEADFCGVHWEGRYLNPRKRGSHSSELIAKLSTNEIRVKEFAECKALHMTAAFELDKSGDFAKALRGVNPKVTLALGHTMADYEEACKAEKLGVTAYTHLFNAMPPIHHRDGGAVCAALYGNAYAELICDGIHVSKEMMSLAYRLKGIKKLVLVSDSIEATGCPDGNYSMAGSAVTVKNGKAVLNDGTLAGSTLTLDRAVRNLMKYCSVSLEDAIVCATENPAKAVGVFGDCGSIDVGKKADMLFVSDRNAFAIDKIMLRGSFIDK